MNHESFRWECVIEGEIFEFSIYFESKCSSCGSEGCLEPTVDGTTSGRSLCMTCANVFYSVPSDVIAVMERIAKEERDANRRRSVGYT